MTTLPSYKFEDLKALQLDMLTGIKSSVFMAIITVAGSISFECADFEPRTGCTSVV